MELATLLIVAALRGVRAGGVFTVDGNPAEGDPEDPRLRPASGRGARGQATDDRGRPRRHRPARGAGRRASSTRGGLTSNDQNQTPCRALVAVVALAITATTGVVAAQSRAAPTGLKATYVSSEPIGVNPFLQLIAEGLTTGGTEFGVETKVIETADIRPARGRTSGRPSRTATTSSWPTRSTRSDAVTKLAGGVPGPEAGRSWTPPWTAPNVRGLVFREHEGAFLVGAIFGLLATGQYEGFPQSDVDRRGGRYRPALHPPLVRRLRGGRPAR